MPPIKLHFPSTKEDEKELAIVTELAPRGSLLLTGHSVQDTLQSVATVESSESVSPADDDEKGTATATATAIAAVAAPPAPKQPEKKKLLSKYEKKMKRYKGTDDREKAFLAIADSSRSFDSKRLYDFMAWKMEESGRGEPERAAVDAFFQTMCPQFGTVLFSSFVKVIGSDGDVVAAFDEFLKTHSEEKKGPKVKKKRNKK